MSAITITVDGESLEDVRRRLNALLDGRTIGDDDALLNVLDRVLDRVVDLTKTTCMHSHGPDGHAPNNNTVTADTIAAYHDGQYRALTEIGRRIRLMAAEAEHVQ